MVTSVTRLVNDDSHLLYRIVGYYEYQRALENLDRLIRISSPDELKIYEQIVRERPELSVATNLSRRLQRLPSSLAEPVLEPNDDFIRNGLPWMTALARVELGAMLSGFSPAKHAFQALTPTPFDQASYHELLLDGARAHYWSLYDDPRLKWMMGQRSEGVYKIVLSYARRLLIARSMLRTAQGMAGGMYTPVQHQEVLQWRRNMDDAQEALVKKIEQLVGVTTLVASRTVDRDFTRACTSLLSAEQRELQAGTARVEQLGSSGDGP